MAQLVKNPPAVRETWVQSLGWEDPLEEGKATHSSVLAWRIPWTVQSVGSQRVVHDRETFTFTFGSETFHRQERYKSSESQNKEQQSAHIAAYQREV